MRFSFRAVLWIHDGDAGWHFLTLPSDLADEIEVITEGTQRGFGSVRVGVTIGGSSWATSLFPSAEAESFVLPVKKPVRTAEGLTAGDLIDVDLELLDEPGVINP